VIALQLFHFLRPEWLVLFPLGVGGWWILRQRARRQMREASLVAPHLREALTVHRGGLARLQPLDGVAVVFCSTVLAAAGPTWSRQVSPWFAENAPLVLAIEVSDSMRATDLLPSRLDRARYRVLDLVAARPGARTAVLAYAGTAHVLLPRTSDLDVIRPLIASLDPAVMPVAGAVVEPALSLAEDLLGDDAARGTVVLVNDGFEASDIPAMQAFRSRPDAPGLAALVVGTDGGGAALLPDGTLARSADGRRVDSRVDPAMLRRVTREAGVPVTRLQGGDEDLGRLLRAIESQLAQADDPDERWKDQGRWFLGPAALALLFSFRRGWRPL